MPNIVTGGLGQEGKKLGLEGKQARERREGGDEEEKSEWGRRGKGRERRGKGSEAYAARTRREGVSEEVSA